MGVTSLTFVETIIHSFELRGLNNRCLAWSLFFFALVATLGGIVVISLAIPFDQMLGFGPLVLISVTFVPNFRIAGVVQNELEATTRSIQELSDLLDLISRPTQLAGGGPPGGIVLP